jgi:hypothetical protein
LLFAATAVAVARRQFARCLGTGLDQMGGFSADYDEAEVSAAKAIDIKNRVFIFLSKAVAGSIIASARNLSRRADVLVSGTQAPSSLCNPRRRPRDPALWDALASC